MTEYKNSFQVIKDPIYGAMQFTNEEFGWIIPFIDNEDFQRLRHIKQSGLCDWFFPGAVHTRFNHSLGCCYVASQIANKIGLTAEEKQIVMIAALLHDIGHGPFSHAFEAIFHKGCIVHEMWTPSFFQQFANSYFLERINRRMSIPLTTDKLKLIERIIMHKEHDELLLADIVSSQLDADRLDYLRRDTYFCGVSYGQYDFLWLLHCLTIAEDEGNKRLGIAQMGVGTVEHYLMARRLMTRNVYHHGKKHAVEYLLMQFLKYLAEGLLNDQRFNVVKHKTLAQFIMAVNTFNQRVEKAENQAEMIQQFLHESYPLYKELCDYDVFSMFRRCSKLEFNHPAVHIARRLHKRRLPRTYHIPPNQIAKAKVLISKTKQLLTETIDDWQIDLTRLWHRSYCAEDDPVLVVEENGTVKKLEEHSLVMNAVSDQWENMSLIIIDHALLRMPEVRNLCKALALL
ncbi:MAG: HD domain-containing protein [Gammaproteobacteria bacterium]|nr:HD domain-containing protein [Gammaproteobacteria bacterium]